MKTAKIESYHFILYRIESAVQRIDCIDTTYLGIAFLWRKNEKEGFNYFSFPYSYTGLSINVCNLWVHVKVQVCQYTMSMYLADNHCVYLFISIIIHVSLKNLHYPHLSHRFNFFDK